MTAAVFLSTAVIALCVWAGIEMRPAERPLRARSARSSNPLHVLETLGRSVVERMTRRLSIELPPLCPKEHRMVGASLVSMTILLFVLPVLALLPAVVTVISIWARRHRAEQIRKEEILAEMPVMIELTSQLVRSGYNLTLTLHEITTHLNGPLSFELGVVLREVDRGRRLGDALDDLPTRTCEEMRPFVWALTASERYGAPLGDVLDRLSFESRAFIAARAEQSVRKLTVQLLFPVAGLTLPAFALLTVAPFVVSSLRTVASSFN